MSTAAGPAAPVRILLVDDRPEKLMALEAVLHDLGDIVKANSGAEALKALLNEDFAVILLDVNMPHMDGFEFVAALKSDKSLPNIPVIFLTSFEEGDHRGKELGAVGYLTKPVRADKLLQMVAKHVPGGAIPIG